MSFPQYLKHTRYVKSTMPGQWTLLLAAICSIFVSFEVNQDFSSPNIDRHLAFSIWPGRGQAVVCSFAWHKSSGACLARAYMSGVCVLMWLYFTVDTYHWCLTAMIRTSRAWHNGILFLVCVHVCVEFWYYCNINDKSLGKEKGCLGDVPEVKVTFYFQRKP